MPSCTFIKPGLHTTLQDKGRKGLAYYAIPRSGIMDERAADLANTLVGNELSTPVIEATLMGPTIQFQSSALIAITGTDMQWKVNDRPVELYRSLHIKSGDILSSGATKQDIRSYIAIRGDMLVDQSYGSCSAYSYANLGHNKGQGFQKGDKLEWREVAGLDMDIDLKNIPVSKKIKLYPGPEYNLLTDEAKQILIREYFYITPDTNRMGAKLEGKQMELKSGLDKSVAILPGFIQLPPGGQPIVILQDGQTTGGYPRIAFLKEQELSQFNSLPLKAPFQFYF